MNFSFEDKGRGGPPPLPSDSEKLQWGRYFAAVWRYKFLIVLLIAIGVVAGREVANRTTPEFEAAAGIWVHDVQAANGGGVAPVRTEGALTALAWMQLIKSPPILDSVVKDLSLNIWYERVQDSALFDNFTTKEEVRVGSYSLSTDSVSGRWMLTDPEGLPLDSGAVGDSIGVKFGFFWAPKTIALESPAKFEVMTLRDATVRLDRDLRVLLADQGGIMSVNLTGSNPKLIASTVNAVVEHFVGYADTLMKKTQKEVTRQLEAQKNEADSAYNKALTELHQFKIKTITVPTANVAVRGGVAETQDIVVGGYMRRREQLREIGYDLGELRVTLPKVMTGELAPSAFLSIPSVGTKSPDLGQYIAEYRTAQSDLEVSSRSYVAESEELQRARERVRRVKENQIVPAARALIAQLSQDSAQLRLRLAGEETEMEQIPDAFIDNLRLTAAMELRQETFQMLTDRHAQAVMAELGTTPPVQLSFGAAQPSQPSNAQMPMRMFAIVVLMAVAISIAMALLLDRMDKRFRYPDQATRELGLTVLGVVPKIRKIRSWASDPAVAASVVEAFRTVRLALANAFPQGEPITVAVSSPGIGDGKSLVAGNLASALADGGYRTLLIDGDTRRGELHDMFGVPRRPGLLDHLSGNGSLQDIIRPTSHQNLWMIAGGTRTRNGPELLMTQAAKPMMDELKSRFDAIVIDTPPLGAGVDAYVLSTAVNNLILVLRAGHSDRKLADAKLDLMDRLPVRVVGTVLNGVNGAKAYQYYKYIDGYTAGGEEMDIPTLAAPDSGTALTKKAE